MINERSATCKKIGCFIKDCEENGRCMDISAKTAGARAFTDHNDVARDPIGAYSEIAKLRDALDNLRELHYDADAPVRNHGLIAAYWSAHLDATVNTTDVATMLKLLELAQQK